MNLCSTCKYFTPQDVHRHETNMTIEIFGSCSRWATGYGTPEIAENEVLVENDEGWGALMGSKFGCVLWEAK